jgi:hypothetical protein
VRLQVTTTGAVCTSRRAHYARRVEACYGRPMDESHESGDHFSEVRAPWTSATLAIGMNGWLGFANADQPDWVYVRVQENEHGRLVITELYLERERLDSAALRGLPLGRIEALANASPFTEGIRAKLNGAPRPGVEPQSPERRPRWEPREIISPTPHLPHLIVPKGKKPDRFYKEAAELYTELAAESRRPAADLAKRCGVATQTVHRWIAEARKRGYLLPADRGRRG